MATDVTITSQDVARAQVARRWNLTFPDPIEARFEREIGAQRAKALRRAMPRTVFVYNVFLIGDYFLAADTFWLAVTLHLALVTPWMVTACFLMSRPIAPLKRNLIIASIPLAIIGGIITVFSVTRDPFAAHYQYFVIIALIYGNAALRPSYPLALVISVVTVLVHAAALILHPGIAPPVAASAIGALVVAAYVSLNSNFSIERDLRRLYLLRLTDMLAASDLQRAAADLHRISYVDPLTGLANRRGIDARADALFAGVAPQGRSFAVLMVDVDHFKGFNDRYGHPEGDRCLARVAGAIRDTVRDGLDVVGRYGGEEFLVILPDSDLADARRVAERMRLLVERLGISYDQVARGIVTISIGVGIGDAAEPASLAVAVANADAALYEAKADGRNCVRPLASPQAGKAIGHAA